MRRHLRVWFVEWVCCSCFVCVTSSTVVDPTDNTSASGTSERVCGSTSGAAGLGAFHLNRAAEVSYVRVGVGYSDDADRGLVVRVAGVRVRRVWRATCGRPNSWTTPEAN